LYISGVQRRAHRLNITLDGELVARVELSAAAVEDLEALILTHSLPDDTRARVRFRAGMRRSGRI
jgi:hypothetical protein